MNTTTTKKISFIVVCLAAVSVTMQIAANLVSARTMPVIGHAAPLGVFFFPLVYVISDVTSDVYGYRISRWIAWITVLMQLVLVGSIRLVIDYTTPCGEFSQTLDGALRLVFSSGAIIVIAGIAGVHGRLRDGDIIDHSDGNHLQIVRLAHPVGHSQHFFFAADEEPFIRHRIEDLRHLKKLIALSVLDRGFHVHRYLLFRSARSVLSVAQPQRPADRPVRDHGFPGVIELVPAP
jgi:hypothetical protein